MITYKAPSAGKDPISFVFSFNGDSFLFHGRTRTVLFREQELTFDQFPSPNELWSRYLYGKDWKAEPTQQIITQDYHNDGTDRMLRYYQANAAGIDKPEYIKVLRKFGARSFDNLTLQD